MTKSHPPRHPGEVLLDDYLLPLKMTQTEAARRMGMTIGRLNEIIRGRRNMTANTALRLQQVFAVPAEFWLQTQALWDLYHAARDMKRAG